MIDPDDYVPCEDCYGYYAKGDKRKISDSEGYEDDNRDPHVAVGIGDSKTPPPPPPPPKKKPQPTHKKQCKIIIRCSGGGRRG